MIVSPSKRSNDTSQVIDSVLREETDCHKATVSDSSSIRPLIIH